MTEGVYVDTSAFVKRYALEPGSAVVRQILAQGNIVVASSRVLVAEIQAAIARKVRGGHVDTESMVEIRRAASRDLAVMDLIDVTSDVTDLCLDLIDRHTLRGFDAIHLATAILVAGDDRETWTFLCSDGELLAAAREEGFVVLDPAVTPPVERGA